MRLNEEAVRMTNLVENLLSLARADGGAEAMSLAPIEVRILFHNVHRTWAAGDAARSARLSRRGSQMTAWFCWAMRTVIHATIVDPAGECGEIHPAGRISHI
jgi:signal transduction histidine kinase